MAVSSKDLETLWQRYTVEAAPAGISVNQFFESNGIPYHVFEKWYKKKFQSPNVVDCVVQDAPPKSGVASPKQNQAPSTSAAATLAIDEVVVRYVNLGLSNGMKIEHHNLSYASLQSFIQKLQTLCLA